MNRYREVFLKALSRAPVSVVVGGAGSLYVAGAFLIAGC
jgi:putative NADH-flavin reductase